MTEQGPQSKKQDYLPAYILIVSLFFAWGVASSLNAILIPQFKVAFALTDFQTGLVQSAFYGGYFFFAMPAALFMRRFGYQAAVVGGLSFFGVGAFLFVSAAAQHEYVFFLGALLVIASGLAFLETSANPLVAALGSPETSGRRLNFAQAFNPLGLLSGVCIGRLFILSDEQLPVRQMANAAARPYMVLGVCVLLWAFLAEIVKFPSVGTAHIERDADKSGQFLKLFGYPRFLCGVTAQFFYVATQVGVWSFTIRYSQHVAPGIPVTVAADILFCSLATFMVGRFVGTALMQHISPNWLMVIYASIGIVLTLSATLVGGWTGIICLMATNFFLSIMYPTIFAESIRGLGPLTKSGSSFLVMAIVGGAVAPPIMGLISDLSSMQYAMAVPSFCLSAVLAFALLSGVVWAKSGATDRTIKPWREPI